ncbi:hypothetical protein H5410_052021 [Solanum commersonii]|uniref:Uncharacterized protein n=1 Tax=Solanum commersonii TaxID=4109 RepID=A0A9J5X077_SOLCO|nr:hypothetical protein H5410_052021 [Solanum commersonii]
MDHRLWIYNMHYETGAGLKPEVHEMINDAFGVQGGMEPKQYFDEAPNEEARHFYDQLEESSRPLCEGSPHSALSVASCSRNKPNRNDEGDIDPLFPPISIFNQNGLGSKKHGKRGFTNMEMQSTVTHILLNCPEIQPYMSPGCDGDRHCEHLGVSQTKQAKKKKSRKLIHPEDIVGSISSASGRINHDTHLFDILFGTVDHRQYYPNYRRPVGASSTSQALPARRYEDLLLQAIRRARPLSASTPSPTGTSPQLSAMRIVDSSSEQSDAMTARPSAKQDDEMPTLAPGQKDRLGDILQRMLPRLYKTVLKDFIHRLITLRARFQTEYARRCLMNLRLCVLGSRGTIWSLRSYLRGGNPLDCLAG